MNTEKANITYTETQMGKLKKEDGFRSLSGTSLVSQGSIRGLSRSRPTILKSQYLPYGSRVGSLGRKRQHHEIHAMYLRLCGACHDLKREDPGRAGDRS